jgi:two-component sensor histidine kinase
MTESVWTRVIPAAPPAIWQGQLLALVAVAVAFGLRFAITPLIGPDRLPFLTFFPAVLIATAIGGRWAGVTALATSAFVAVWAFTPPLFAIDFGSSQVAWFFIAFLVSGGVIWFTAVLLRRSVLRFREKQAQLEVEVAQRERAAEQLRTVAHELEHRVRNLLALIHGLVLQSGRGSESVEAFQKALGERLQALAKAQHLVSDIGSNSLPLPRLLGDAVRPFAEAGERFRLEGPEIMVPADIALPLALALHELSTNAVKYGALSASDGRVELSWSQTGDQVALVWKERDGPPVKAPDRRGFGSRLLESALAAHSGRSSIDFEPDGVRYLATFDAATA